MSDNTALTDLIISILGTAPATLSLLYLIYRQEKKEQQIMDALIDITRQCFEARLAQRLAALTDDPPDS